MSGEANPVRSHAGTSAAEAKIVAQASDIRVDERRDMVGDMTESMIESVHNTIFNHWGPEEIVDIVGPGGAMIWVKFSGELLKTGEYDIKVDPDSAVPQTRAAREAKAAQVYQLLKTNPLLDPQKLTQYLLHEMHGVQFDDMMRALPPPEAFPDAPITPREYSQLIGHAFKTTQDGGQLDQLQGGGSIEQPPQTLIAGQGGPGQ